MGALLFWITWCFSSGNPEPSFERGISAARTHFILVQTDALFQLDRLFRARVQLPSKTQISQNGITFEKHQKCENPHIADDSRQVAGA